MAIRIDGNKVRLKGLVRWASVPPAEPKKPHKEAFNPNEPDNCFWSIEVECTDAELKKILALIGKKPGDAFAQQLREYKEDVVSSSGEVMAKKTNKKFLTVKKTKIKGDYDFGEIPVQDAKGNDIIDVGIGNDSEAIVHISIESVKKGSSKKTIRLNGVRVTKLIPFELSGKAGLGDDDDMLTEEEMNNLNEEQNQQAMQAASDDLMDDDVPF